MSIKRNFSVTLDTVAEVLAYELVQRKCTLREVAKDTGISISSLSRIARGFDGTVGHMRTIAGWCGLSPKQFWDLTEVKSGNTD